MPVLYSTADMEEMAKKLSKMRFQRAKGYARGLDKHSRIELWRNAVEPGRWMTRLALPTLGLMVSLVEIKEDYGKPDSHGYLRSRFRYVEAHVDPLPPSHYDENTGNPPEYELPRDEEVIR